MNTSAYQYPKTVNDVDFDDLHQYIHRCHGGGPCLYGDILGAASVRLFGNSWYVVGEQKTDMTREAIKMLQEMKLITYKNSRHFITEPGEFYAD